MSVERTWASSAVGGLLLLAALLIFPNLDDRYLGDDEAETALLARSVLRFGVPVAWDAVSLISQECGGDHHELPLAPDAAPSPHAFCSALLGLLAVPKILLYEKVRG